MGPVEIIVVIAAAAIVVSVIVAAIIRKKKGKCSCDCASCKYSCCAYKKPEKEEKGKI